jgi:hypothetical protein
MTRGYLLRCAEAALSWDGTTSCATLRKLAEQPCLIDGFLAGTRLDLTPLYNHHN